jgi:hypothetical protein
MNPESHEFALHRHCVAIADAHAALAGKIAESVPPANSTGDTWPLRPFDPSCRERVAVDAATMDAVRCVIADWDGTNWAAVEAAIQRAALLRPLSELTVFDVRMQFAVGQRDLVLKLGGTPRTTDGTIVTVKPEPAADAKLDTWNGLTDRQRVCLIALRELGAFDADRRQRAVDIATQAEGPAVDPAGFKEPLSELVTQGLIGSKRGAAGGYWLSAEGRALLGAMRPKQERRAGSV